MNPALHLQLKEGTQDLHTRIEETSSLKNVFSEHFSLQDYQDVLQNLYQIFFHWEKELKKSSVLSDWIPDLAQRWKTESLQRDLKTSAEPEAMKLPLESLNLSQALGVFYVLEGSALGGQVIRRKLSARAGWDEQKFHFYGHYGDQVGSFWKRFLEILNQKEILSQIEPAETVRAARATFEMMIEVFSKPRPV